LPNKLPKGSILQVIYASGGTIHAPNPDGSPAGGDTLVDSTNRTIGTLDKEGYFYYQLNALQSGKKAYIRVWNANSLVSATHYNDTTTFDITSSTPPAIVYKSYDSFSTTIPKPAVTQTLTFSSPSIYRGAEYDLTITNNVGSFTDATTFDFGAGISVLTKTRSSGTSYNVRIRVLTSAASGDRSITASTGGSGNLTISAPSSTLAPVSGDQGWTSVVLTVTGTGTHFETGKTTASF